MNRTKEKSLINKNFMQLQQQVSVYSTVQYNLICVICMCKLSFIVKYYSLVTTPESRHEWSWIKMPSPSVHFHVCFQWSDILQTFWPSGLLADYLHYLWIRISLKIPIYPVCCCLQGKYVQLSSLAFFFFFWMQLLFQPSFNGSFV